MASVADALRIVLDLDAAGRGAEALALCDRILDVDPDNPQALYLAGTLGCRSGRFTEARGRLERAARLLPDQPALRLMLAQIDAAAGDGAAAAERSRRALTLAPGEAGAWALLGTGLRRTGATEGAVAALRRARDLAPGDADIAGKLGLLLHERGCRRLEDRHTAAALADLSAAAALLPFDPDLAFALATALTEAGRPAEALALHRRVLALNPDGSRLLHNAGVAHLRAGAAEAAVTVLRRATLADPDNPDPCEGLAEALQERDPSQALQWSTAALAIKLRHCAAPAEPLGGEVPGTAGGGERTRDVVSFSLWGGLEVYCGGAIANARTIPDLLPGWRCRFYHDDTTPRHVLAELAALGAELVAMPPGTAGRRGMFWRFLVADDPGVRRFLCRDADSRPTAREIAAVAEWTASGTPFHVLRDHVMHMEPVMGGLWGGTAGLLPPVGPAIDRFTAARPGRWNDQHFLAEWLWPRIAHRVLIHDGVHSGAGHPLPAVPDRPGDRHVGAKLFHLTRLPPIAAPDGPDGAAMAEGRHGMIVHPAGDPHIGRSLALLGDWLEIEAAFCAGFLTAGDTVVDADAGVGAHALAFARAVGAAGRVVATERSAGLFDLLRRTAAANGRSNLTVRHDPADRRGALLAGVQEGGAPPRLVRAAVTDGADPLVDPLAAAPADRRPILYLRVEDDAAAAGVFARLRALGYGLWWHLATVFDPANRLAHSVNPFPGLVAVNALALPPGHPPPDRPLPPVDPASGSDWRAAAWRLSWDGR
ncbi:tetratricopeptide repeat protein [Azospirillum halopraeferens]|uniref:tetratricopeptide repeat protein n=1 Tax=Azospirillum halopraeferens TaxID=34010 RepID=UPI0004065EAA|nr:tetratricopeptide repeat protein [Azospirillum halopraeferens]